MEVEKKKDKDKTKKSYKEFDPKKYVDLQPRLNEMGEVEFEEQILDKAQRRARGRLMKRMQHKLSRGRKIASRRRATSEKLMSRAKKAALLQFKNRFAGEKSYNDLSTDEKIRIDTKVKRIPKARIERVAKKLFKQMKRAEASKNQKTEELNRLFNTFLAERKQPEDKDVGDREGSQPKSYYKGLDKDEKEKRAKHFAKTSKMGDDDPKAYKPAPGDEDIETKPSKHTKKFKQMYGEASERDTTIKKRYHKLLNKDGSVCFDKRFKMFKCKPKDEPYNPDEFVQDAKKLMEAVHQYEVELSESNVEKTLKDKAEKAGVGYAIVKKVYDRGVAAWRTGHRPGTTPTQWGLARVNSFLTGGKTRSTADKDLWDKHKKG